MFFTNVYRRAQRYFNFDSQSEKAEEHAQHILGYFENRNWTALQQQLILPLRYLLPESALESGWKLVTATIGPLRRTGRPEIKVGWLFNSVQVPLQFSRSTFTLNVWMTGSGRIVVLQLAPQRSLPWKPPVYESPVRDISMCLGRWPRRVQATLSLPEGDKSPCIILLGGSGPVDKDSSVGALKPFKDLAVGLAGRGIAVCRFDKLASTLVGKLTIRKKDVTLTEEYIHHVLEAVAQVRRIPEIDANRIILLGHSLGGIVAARLVAIDKSLAGCILMATPAEPMYRCAIRQMQYLNWLDTEQSTRFVPNAAYETTQIRELQEQADVADSSALDLSTPASDLPFGIGPAYWLEYREFNPLESLGGFHRPVLVLQGDRDYQVTSQGDYAKLHEKFGSLPNFDFHLYENLNHLFAWGQGFSGPLDYETPANVDIGVINDIERWIKHLTL